MRGQRGGGRSRLREGGREEGRLKRMRGKKRPARGRDKNADSRSQGDMQGIRKIDELEHCLVYSRTDRLSATHGARKRQTNYAVKIDMRAQRRITRQTIGEISATRCPVH